MTFPPETTGPAKPSPRSTRQAVGGPSAGHEAETFSGVLPSRRGPRNCGQSAAQTWPESTKLKNHPARMNKNYGPNRSRATENTLRTLSGA